MIENTEKPDLYVDWASIPSQLKFLGKKTFWTFFGTKIRGLLGAFNNRNNTRYCVDGQIHLGGGILTINFKLFSHHNALTC